MASAFAGKHIVVGVTGSIGAFKVAGWVSELAKDEAQVTVVMTDAATKFIAPLTFSALSGNRVYTRMFGEHDDEPMAHINLGRDADVVLIAPATANTIAKLSAGFGDDLLSTTVLATRADIILCPAMNSRMYTHPATIANLASLRRLNYTIIDPGSGMMACKEVGEGRLAEWEEVKAYLAKSLSPQDLAGKKVLVTAGPTREPLDPARFLSNRSSGKMGYALAGACFRRGAEVVLVSGPSNLPRPVGVERILVETAQDMYEAVLSRARDRDIIIKAAAVADYRPTEQSAHKAKKEEIRPTLAMTANPDILFTLGQQKKDGQLLVGFGAESRNLQEEGMRKFNKKNLDMIAVNDIGTENTGFAVDTNQLMLITASGVELLPLTSKDHGADLLVDRIIALLKSR